MARKIMMSETDRLMARYGTAPLGGGSWGVWDSYRQKWVEIYNGRGARQKASRKWRELVKA